MMPYKSKSDSNYIKIRDLDFHYLTRGNPQNPVLLMLHGFMDQAYTFDLIADELDKDFYLIAWDARGFGKTEAVHPSGYYHFYEYLYDLDIFINQLKLNKPTILGHSMGGMIASLYTGVYPDKVNKLINIEGWFIGDFDFSSAPAKVHEWISSMSQVTPFKPLKSLEDAAQKLIKADPLMPFEFALHLAEQGTKQVSEGLIWRHDPFHKTKSPYLPYKEQILAFWGNITCPVLLLKGSKTNDHFKKTLENELPIKNTTFYEIEDAGHNVHIHKPQVVSNLIRDFLKS